MNRMTVKLCGVVCLLAASATDLRAQKPPYDVFPPAEPPYYSVRYEASNQPGELAYAVNYTIWIPPGVKTLRGVIVHQHGCGEGSCKSGLTGAYDLHWQALAKKHDCALLSPAYEQPEKADCQMWCDPRNGSDAAFRKCLADLGKKSGHSELAKVPWALWGHSGGGHWAGGMVMLHPDRVAAAWLRSGVPLLKADPNRKGIKAHKLPDAVRKVPLMCNLGTKEGVTEKGKQFAGVWPANQVFFNQVRGQGGLVGVAVDPLSSHDCGNQRYLAIPWLDACLSARPAPLRGYKGSTFEGGIRVPCVVRWPGVLPAGAESDLPALTFDLTASILRAAGAEPVKERPLDGIDVLKAVTERGATPGRTLFWRGRRGEQTWCAVRDGSLKLVVRRNKGQTEEYLFDLARDPEEKDNLLAKRADDATRLKKLLAAWERDVRPAR